MAVVRCVERPEHAIEIAEGMELGDPFGADQLHAVPDPAAHRYRVAQPVQLIRSDREPQGSGLVPADRPAGLRLQIGVLAGSVPGHPRQAVTGCRMGDLACGVPGRSGGQFALLQQQAVVPTLDGQVIEEGHTHDPPTDDDYPGVRGHAWFGQGADGPRQVCGSGNATGKTCREGSCLIRLYEMRS